MKKLLSVLFSIIFVLLCCSCDRSSKDTGVDDDDKEFGMAIRIQNYVGRISLRLASFFKRIYKGDKNVREKHG